MDSMSVVYVVSALAVAAAIAYQIFNTAAERSLKSMAGKVLKGPPQYPRIYSETDLKDLPVPVQRYFKTVLKEGQRFARTVQVEHIGNIKTSKTSGWSWIRGTEFFSARYPAFVWRGKTTWFTATDSFVGGKGALSIRFLSLFRIANYSGKNIDRSELQRWIAEAVWFPTALLPCKSLRWSAIDDNTALLEYYWGQSRITFTVSFSDDHKISKFATERHDSDGNLTPWIGSVSRYQRHGGMLIPSCMEACWTDPSQPYAKFQLTKIDHEF